jgi:hypothetical protein
MKGKTYLYRVGEPNPIVTELDRPLDLDPLQKAVEGFIEVVPYFDTFVPPSDIKSFNEGEPLPCVVFCNEEGKIHKLPVNYQATRLWDCALRRVRDANAKALYPNGLSRPDGGSADVLVGPVLIVTGDPEFMESL